jgi:predicted nuclease of predicted toxin-antitoxin system
MRFLLDNNLSPRLGTLLAEAGHDVVHVRDVGLAQAPDDAVLARAEGEDRILISADTDFGTLLARSNRSRPSFMLIRRAVGRRVEQQAGLILNSLIDVEADLDVGSIVVLGETTIRIRRLPLAPE